MNLKQFEKAIECYKKALEIKPDEHEAWYNMGNAYGNLKQFEKALESINKAIEIAKEVTGYQENRFVITLLFSLEKIRKGKFQQGLDGFKNTLKDTSPIPEHLVHKTLGIYFKELLGKANREVIRKAIIALEESRQNNLLEFLKPYKEALKYLDTKDKNILNRLFPEIREIVMKIVTELEKEKQ